MDRKLKGAVSSMLRLNPAWKCADWHGGDRVSFQQQTDDGLVKGEMSYIADRNGRVCYADIHLEVNDTNLLFKRYDTLFFDLIVPKNVSFIVETIQNIFRMQKKLNFFEQIKIGQEAKRKNREKENQLKKKYLS